MGVLRIAGFAGMWPIRDPRALPDNAAVDAVNIRVGGGAYLKGARQPSSIKSVGAALNVYRIPSGVSTEPLASSYWMTFSDVDTDVLRGPLVNDAHQRFYWASPSTGYKFATKATILAGGAGLTVGVPAPTTRATVAVVAGTGEIVDGKNVAPRVTRSYIYTFQNEYGEESAPSPTFEAHGHTDQDWLIQNMQAPPAQGSYAAFSKKRIYRTVSGNAGTDFYLVVELPATQTFYTDRLSDLVVSGQGGLGSNLFHEPPAMDGIVAMPNGVFVGWKDNNLYFSENFRPHAWPAEYTLTVDFPIVGLGVFGNTCVVCTTGSPSMVSGVQGESMSLAKVDAPLPCLSRRSIVSTMEGVYYASEEGLVLIGPSGANIVTEDLIDRAQWRTKFLASSQRAAMIDGEYTFSVSENSRTTGYKLNPRNAAATGVIKFELPYGLRNIGVEPWTGRPWVIAADGTLYEWEDPNTGPWEYRWRSREYQYPLPTNFRAFQCYFDGAGGGTLHMRAWATLRGNDGSVVRTLVYDHPIPASGRIVSFPSGFKSDVWQFEFVGTAELQSFVISTTIEELKSA